MFKFSAMSQIWKKYIQKLNDWDLSLSKNQFIYHIWRQYLKRLQNKVWKTKFLQVQ